MRYIIFILLLLTVSCGGNTGNSGLEPKPRWDVVTYQGRSIEVDGWVTFRGVDIPYVQIGGDKDASFTLPELLVLRFKLPLLTQQVITGLERLGFTVDFEDRAAITALLLLIMEETGLNERNPTPETLASSI